MSRRTAKVQVLPKPTGFYDVLDLGTRKSKKYNRANIKLYATRSDFYQILAATKIVMAFCLIFVKFDQQSIDVYLHLGEYQIG